MSDSSVDTLILGQGIAGSLLAWTLIHNGQTVRVIDDAHKSSSSEVAAGIVNPLAGMRFNRRPQMGDWLQAADRSYAELAAEFGTPFFRALPMLRLFRSAEQRRFHQRRREDPASRDLLDAAFEPGECPETVAAPHGGFTQHRTGYVDMPLLLRSLRTWLHEQGALIEHELAFGQIELLDHGVSAAGIQARRLVFCDGARLHNNPWFSHLPLAPDKGEILNLRIDGWHPRHIINAAHWLVPMENGELRLGATHDHESNDKHPTSAGRRELLRGLNMLLPSLPNSRVTLHQAGIRPGTSDRCPLLGRHPEHRTLWVCNGFGARGALTVPWYARCLADNILDGVALPAEADIGRFR